jgi:hypothetical protein
MKKFAIAACLATVFVAPALARPVAPSAPGPRADVYYGQQYVGSDPDPQVRFDLRREAPSYLGDN